MSRPADWSAASCASRGMMAWTLATATAVLYGVRMTAVASEL